MSARPVPPPILDHAGPLLAGYDVLFCDVWGVIHDGHRAFTEACDALTRFRQGGGTVILVSNAPVPKERVAAMLDLRAVPHDAYDDIVASGEIALSHIVEKGYARLYAIGPADRDAATFARLPSRPVALEEAQAILCTGLNDDRTETADDYREVLERARALRLPFVCANPDLVVDVGGRQFICAGAIADLYERMDGEVFWAGKPHANAYAAARRGGGRHPRRPRPAVPHSRRRRLAAHRPEGRRGRRHRCHIRRLGHSSRRDDGRGHAEP